MNDLKMKLENLIKQRAAQLEEVKPFISLKAFNSLVKKLELEKLKVHGGVAAQESEQRKREQPQAMPKPYFEQRRLPKKPIRID
jgi:hypothetical protein